MLFANRVYMDGSHGLPERTRTEFHGLHLTPWEPPDNAREIRAALDRCRDADG